jgi:hypothetical protein
MPPVTAMERSLALGSRYANPQRVRCDECGKIEGLLTPSRGFAFATVHWHVEINSELDLEPVSIGEDFRSISRVGVHRIGHRHQRNR